MSDEEQYLCVGICMADPDSGYCLGCGRPPLASPEIVVELTKPAPGQAQHTNDPDSPA